MHTLKPMDMEAIVRASEETGRIITVENHSIIGGLGSAVAEVISEHAPCRLVRMGFNDCFIESGDNEDVFSKLGINTENIVSKARQMMGSRKT